MWYNLCWKFAARFRATDPAGPWTACLTAAVRSLYELVIRHCGVTGKRTFCCGHGCCPLHGVLAGAGAAGGGLSEAAGEPVGRGGAPLCPPARRPQLWAVFFALPEQKTGKPGINRKVLLYNRHRLCYSNLVRKGNSCPLPPSLASPGGDTCPGAACGEYFLKGGNQP